MTKGDRGKDHRLFEWAVLPRCLLSGLSTVVQSENYREKGLHSNFSLICCLLMLSHHLACSTSWTNAGLSLTVIERVNGCNFTVSCNINKQKQNSLHKAFLWGSFSLKFWLFFFFSMKEAGALAAEYAIWKADSWRPLVLTNSRYSDVLKRNWAGLKRGKQEGFEIYLISKQASEKSFCLWKAIFTN